MNYLGQDQDSYGGGFSKKQSWSGTITQVVPIIIKVFGAKKSNFPSLWKS